MVTATLYHNKRNLNRCQHSAHRDLLGCCSRCRKRRSSLGRRLCLNKALMQSLGALQQRPLLLRRAAAPRTPHPTHGAARGAGAARQRCSAAGGDYGGYSSNLGALSRTVAADAPAVEIDPYFNQRVSVDRCANSGVSTRPDGSAAAVLQRAPPAACALIYYAFVASDARSFANRGFAIDGGTAVVNGVLLLVLIALAGERIFGLDKVRFYVFETCVFFACVCMQAAPTGTASQVHDDVLLAAACRARVRRRTQQLQPLPYD